MKGMLIAHGDDRKGICARICGFFAKKKINILDISQSDTEGVFNFEMTFDFCGTISEFEALELELQEFGKEINIDISLKRSLF